jgi:hypothetical protein
MWKMDENLGKKAGFELGLYKRWHCIKTEDTKNDSLMEEFKRKFKGKYKNSIKNIQNEL